MHVVVWGDSHIPYRADELPRAFIRFLQRKTPQIIICTGDLVVIDVLEKLEEFGSEVIAVRGNMDEGEAARLPLEKVLNIENIKFYVFHGHGIYPRGDIQQLHHLAKKRNADILLTGHTHHPLIRRYEDIIIINPGSVCGVWGGGGGYGFPTWVNMDVSPSRVKVKILELKSVDVVGVYDERSFKL